MFQYFQPTTKLFINNEFVESKSQKWIDVHDPVSAVILISLHGNIPTNTSACTL